MNNVIYSDIFEAKLKRFAKKFPSILDEIENLANQLEINANLGVAMGSGIHKIRLSVGSKGVGKSGGFRTVRRSGHNLCSLSDAKL